MATKERKPIEEKSKLSQEKPVSGENEAEPDSWDKIYDDSGESVLEKLENVNSWKSLYNFIKGNWNVCFDNFKIKAYYRFTKGRR